LAAAALLIALSPAAHAATYELVASAESHSLEEFASTGAWIATFASTGPYEPSSLAIDSVGDVYVATNTATILRYAKTGKPSSKSASFALPIGSNTIEGLVFDASNNLYVASHYGTGGYVVQIYKFTPADLAAAAPVGTVLANTALGRADQMTFDPSGDLCIADFVAPNTVQCFSTSTGALVRDYTSEIEASGVQPVGIGFDARDRLIMSSTFVGTVLREPAPETGPLTTLTSGLTPALEYLALDSSGAIYVGSWHGANTRFTACYAPVNFYACNDYDFTTDIIYKIDPTSGHATSFISTHIWGPTQIVFFTKQNIERSRRDRAYFNSGIASTSRES
jgi:sugar lactone lactonase YvrE